MKINIYQTHHTIGDFPAIQNTINDILNNSENLPGLHLFPELFLTGYPLQDLVLQKPFIRSFHKLLESLSEAFKALPQLEDSAFLMGGPAYELDEDDLPKKIENVIYLFKPGQGFEVLYTKRLLPNYDIYDEKKYFSPGTEAKVWDFQGKKIALLICEDMWASNVHKKDPVQDLYELGQNLDLVVNLSASPFHLGKSEKREKRGIEISNLLQAPFVYVNRVGGEDEILFDGQSFVLNGNKTICHGQAFHPEVLEFDLPTFKGESKDSEGQNNVTENTWESLFSPRLSYDTLPPQLTPLSDKDYFNLLRALKFGVQEYAKKSGFKKFLVALSGGIDSSLALTICKLALTDDQELEAIFMPSVYTAPLSYELSEKLCKNLGVPLKILPIKFIHSAVKNVYQDYIHQPLEGLSDENIQSRLRGALLYGRSNQTGAMVLNTSNKSELAVGYSTQYGDSVGAISVLGDLYKTEVFGLSYYINKTLGGPIPEEVITRPPSAELREDQMDSQSLPPYERLDAILEGLLSLRLSKDDLISKGFHADDVNKAWNLYKKTEYKRYQFSPIIKVHSKSFGFGYRIPICKKIE